MTFTFHVWHALIVVCLGIVVSMFQPVPNDTFGAGAFIRGIAGIVAILVIWLAYFAGRFILG